nr:TPA_inf: conotoxin precursor Pmag01 [Conus ebraeus]
MRTMKAALFILLVLALGTLGVNGEDGQMMQGKSPSDTFIRAVGGSAGKDRRNECAGLSSCYDDCCVGGTRCTCTNIDCS